MITGCYSELATVPKSVIR